MQDNGQYNHYQQQYLYGLNTRTWPPTVMKNCTSHTPAKMGTILTFDNIEYKISGINTRCVKIEKGHAYYTQVIWIDRLMPEK